MQLLMIVEGYDVPCGVQEFVTFSWGGKKTATIVTQFDEPELLLNIRERSDRRLEVTTRACGSALQEGWPSVPQQAKITTDKASDTFCLSM